MRGGWIVALCALLAPVAGGCAGGAEERAPRVPAGPTAISACGAREGELPAGATLVRGAGRYHLTLVTVRDGAERSAMGTLELADNEPSLRRLPETGDASADTADSTVLLPLYGWAAIDLAAVDALEIGDIGSRDPLQPGVLVLEQRPAANAPVAITLRFGSLANRRHGPQAVDGGYMALHVAHVAEWGSFAGTWSSGVHARRASGHFCATRLP
ncbi:MAG: hypothetical protein OXP69_24625 [Spirochaetaceae bacterium]|nr:hypothetical protein [Spirochaetaceae bacterium]